MERMRRSGLLPWLVMVSMLLSLPEIPASATVIGAKEIGFEAGGIGAEDITGEMPENPVHHCAADGDPGEETDTTDWSYVYFGSYPQTEVSDSELTWEMVEADYDKNGDAWVNGKKYRRISKADTNYDGYFGDREYRYFKWDRIKWKVLCNDGETLFVVADQALDCKKYTERTLSVTWEHCGIRKWLNTEFYGTAFAEEEQDAIVAGTVINEENYLYSGFSEGGPEPGNDTDDAVFLLSIREATNPEFGFCGDYSRQSEARRVEPSGYARARGVTVNESDEFMNQCYWWLRTPGMGNSSAVAVRHDGSFDPGGQGMWTDDYACVPATRIRLSSDLWLTEDDGGSGFGGGGRKAFIYSPANPEYDEERNEMKWSYVSFGRYPQTEVTGEALTPAITGAPYDANGDAWVSGHRYRRISKEDATSDTWFGDQEYRYFKWEKIKWRVLCNDGETLFLMADSGLDCERYHTGKVSVTWENSAIRTWLNEGFCRTAFTERERAAIEEWDVENKSNPEYNTAGGAATKDKVYFLSIEEVQNPAYGFDDAGIWERRVLRTLKPSNYAEARGAYATVGGDFDGNCQWWLRSPGGGRSSAATVGPYGDIYMDGVSVDGDFEACAPVLHVSLNSAVWKEADEGELPEDAISDPAHVCKKAEDKTGYTDTTDFSHVYFGSYPQTEVTDQELIEKIDLELDRPGTGDQGCDAWVDGSKYRRLHRNAAPMNPGFGEKAYRYFKWERICWRVLKCEDSTLFLMADQGLDCRKFNDTEGNHWEDSTVRSWLNDTFYQTAFGGGEKNAIVQWDVDQSDDRYGCSGNNTKDFIYLLSVSEAANPSYGFCADEDDSASRFVESSGYAQALGTVRDCDYWLRTGAGTSTYVGSVQGGYVSRWIASVTDERMACVPVLHVKKDSGFLYLWDDGTSGTGGEGGVDPGDPKPDNPEPDDPEPDNSDKPDNPVDPGNSNNPDNPVNPGKPGQNTNPPQQTVTNPGAAQPKKLNAPKLKIKLHSANSIKLSWNKVDGASKYFIFRSAGNYSNGLKMIKQTTGRTFTDKKLKKGKTYYYNVYAVGVNGATRESNLASRKIPKLTAPRMKLDLKKSKEEFTISWNTIKDAQKIEIYRSVNGKKGPFKKWKTVSARKRKATYSFSGLSRGRGYGYKLKAFYKKDGKTFRSKFSNMDGFNRT